MAPGKKECTKHHRQPCQHHLQPQAQAHVTVSSLPMATIARLISSHGFCQRAEPLTLRPGGRRVRTPVRGSSREDANIVSVGWKKHFNQCCHTRGWILVFMSAKAARPSKIARCQTNSESLLSLLQAFLPQKSGVWTSDTHFKVNYPSLWNMVIDSWFTYKKGVYLHPWQLWGPLSSFPLKRPSMDAWR